MNDAKLGFALLGGLALASVSCNPAHGSGYAPSFLQPLYSRPYAPIPTALNPLVSAEHSATQDYTYLYTPALIDGSPPLVVSHRYATDYGYLLRPSSGASAAATAYRWKPCTDFASQIESLSVIPARSRSGALASRDRPSVARERGHKIDNALKPEGLMPPDGNAPGRLSTVLADLRLPMRSGCRPSADCARTAPAS
jgi:hypothetical protein